MTVTPDRAPAAVPAVPVARWVPFRRLLFRRLLFRWVPRGWLPFRWVPRRWLRLPRRTIRLRLTLLYGLLFLLSGAGLLAITYALVSHQQGPFMIRAGTAFGGAVQAGPSLHICAARQGNTLPAPAQISKCIAFGQSVARQQHAAELSQLLAYSGIALGIMTVASIGLGWLVAGRVLGPLRTITAAARSISASSLHERLALTGSDDELRELGDTFDGLLARLEAAFSAQRQFVANASHELRTPLTRQRTLIEVALADPQPSVGMLADLCGQILVAGEQQEALIEALLTLASSQRGLDRRDLIDLAAITDEVLLARRPSAELRGLKVAASLGPAPALGDARLAERLVANLVDNAVRHNMADGAIEVSTGTWAGQPVLAVSSTGPLIRSDEVGRLFQPFQRGAAAASRIASHGGLGLGLSIVAAIAAAHGAWLRADALPGGGLGVQVGFPPAAYR